MSDAPPATGTIALYERQAAWFDANRDRSLFERPFLDRFADLLPRAARVLDLGCGVGEPIGRYLIGRGCMLTGVDGAVGMIERCKARFPGQEWRCADMRGLDLGRKFDGLIAWHSFFHLPADDQRTMFPVFSAHLKPRGTLMFTSGTQAGTAWGQIGSEQVFHASLDSDGYRGLLEANGFDVVAHECADATSGDHTVWLARKR